MILNKSISSLRQNAAVLSSIGTNERLYTNGRRFSRLKAPDRFLKKTHHPLLKLLHRVVACVLKIFQAIKRGIRGETSELNLKGLEKLNQQVISTLQKDFFSGKEEELYTVLNDLGHIRNHLKKAAAGSLQSYADTLCALDESRRTRIDQIIGQIKDEILPKLEEKINGLESSISINDHMRSEQFLMHPEGMRPSPVKICISTRAYTEALSLRMGAKAVERALHAYGLKNESVLSEVEMAALAIGAAVNVTSEDLPLILPGFEDLSEDKICQKLIAIRKSVNANTCIPIAGMRFQLQLEHDRRLLNHLNDVEEWSAKSKSLKVKDLKQFSYAEYLSRHIVYGLYDQSEVVFPSRLLIPIYDEGNHLRLLAAHSLVSVKGLHGALFEPFRPTTGQNKVHVVFRGTYCKYSILRDINPLERMYSRFFDGPGRQSFMRHQEKMYDRIVAHLQTIPNPVIEFGGHSLGASDAMRAMEYFMYRQSQGKDRLSLSEVVLSAFNTPGIESDIAQRFIESLHELKIKTVLRYFDVHHDYIQELGSARLGSVRSFQKNPDHLSVSIFKFNRRIDELLIALACNIFKRTWINLERAHEAHTYDCLRLHDVNNSLILNGTFIQDVFSNNQDDAKITYGRDNHKRAALTSNEELSSQLLTASCRIGRKLRRITRQAAKPFYRPFGKRYARTAV